MMIFITIMIMIIIIMMILNINKFKSIHVFLLLSSHLLCVSSTPPVPSHSPLCPWRWVPSHMCLIYIVHNNAWYQNLERKEQKRRERKKEEEKKRRKKEEKKKKKKKKKKKWRKKIAIWVVYHTKHKSKSLRCQSSVETRLGDRNRDFQVLESLVFNLQELFFLSSSVPCALGMP